MAHKLLGVIIHPFRGKDGMGDHIHHSEDEDSLRFFIEKGHLGRNVAMAYLFVCNGASKRRGKGLVMLTTNGEKRETWHKPKRNKKIDWSRWVLQIMVVRPKSIARHKTCLHCNLCSQLASLLQLKMNEPTSSCPHVNSDYILDDN